MKFTKDEARKELVARLTAKGETLNLSERSINEQLEKLIPLVANDETEIADFVDKVIPFFKTADANVRNDVSQGIKEFKDNYKPEQKENKETKPEEKKGGESEFEKRLAKLEQELADARRNDKVASIKRSLIEALKNKGVKDEEWTNTFLNEITITEDFDVEAKAQSYLNLYNKSKANTPPDVTPGGTGGASKSEEKRLSEKMKAVKELAEKQRLIG